MDHAIESLKQYLWAALDIGFVDEEEIKAYVDAINTMEKHYYGEVKTQLENVLKEEERVIMENKTMQSLAHELDTSIGAIGLRLETLCDINTILGHLRVDMDNAVHKGEEKYYYRDHHLQVRLLADLLRYTISELCVDYEEASKLKSALFEKAVRQNVAE